MRMDKQIYYVTNGDKSYRNKKNNDGGHTVEGVGYGYQLTTSMSKEPWRNQGVLGFLWHKQAKKDIIKLLLMVSRETGVSGRKLERVKVLPGIHRTTFLLQSKMM